MKKLRNQWLKCFNYLLSGVLLLLGLTSCLEEEDGKYATVEYGIRYSKFAIKGKVVNEEKLAVPDIQLIVKGVIRNTSYSEYPLFIDTLYSDTSGEFEFKEAHDSPDIKYRIVHRDIDKEGNIRIYKTDTARVDMPDPATGIATVEIVLEKNTVKESS